MKKYIKYFLLIGLLGVLGACSDFEDINKDPNAAAEDQINVKWMLNKSITDAQMDPHIAERIFVYYWKDAARQHNFGYLTSGGYNDGFNNDYLNGYISNWMKSAYQLVELADKQLENNSLTSAHDIALTKNIREIARIWYVYLMSEFVDNFGPASLDAFQGGKPTYSSVKDVYYFMLSELKDAASKIDLSITAEKDEKVFDRAFQFDPAKWQAYANSMRMRLAMRISEVDPQKAKAEFEDAVKGPYIGTNDGNFAVKERDGWDPLAGVMSRGWNDQALSETLANIMVGLGGVKSSDQLVADRYKDFYKPQNYLGVRYADHWPTYINDPYTGFFMDGLPYSVDPRAYVIFTLPFEKDHKYFSYTDDEESKKHFFLYKVGEQVKEGEEATKVAELIVDYSFNGLANGSFGDVGSANDFVKQNYRTTPVLANKYRDSKNKRVFFGAWESYFLIAEASIRGWAVPMDGKAAYEKGIEMSFIYNGVERYLNEYLASKEYNRVGTSVAWDHVAEPPATVEMDYVDGYTKKAGKWQYKYPEAAKTFYGKALNDKLTKIITQKYLAQMPWLPLEAWNDHRRLGLPFFENLAVEKPLSRMTQLTKSNVHGKQQFNFFPQRLRYPSSFQNSNSEGYAQALKHLGGDNDIFTPLWWAKKK